MTSTSLPCGHSHDWFTRSPWFFGEPSHWLDEPTTQLYAQIRPAAPKQAVAFYEAKALDLLSP